MAMKSEDSFTMRVVRAPIWRNKSQLAVEPVWQSQVDSGLKTKSVNNAVSFLLRGPSLSEGVIAGDAAPMAATMDATMVGGRQDGQFSGPGRKPY
jgi:hypothetical protein